MSVIGISADVNQKRETFFRLVFGATRGLICVAYIEPGRRGLHEEFFQYPDQMDGLLEYINRHYHGNNMYFCPQLLTAKKRTKANVKECTVAWADLDTCDPDSMLVPPTIAVESSPGRYQALWCFEEPVEASEAETLSQRIAYKHAAEGADRSGWDLTQLLRIPLSYNYKYGSSNDVPIVKIIGVQRAKYRLDDFGEYPVVRGYEYQAIPFPEYLPEESADDILQRHRLRLNPLVWKLVQIEPDDDWSKSLWQVQMLLFEAGLTREEVFVVARASACNKYLRDHNEDRADELLWRETCRAFAKNEENMRIVFPADYVEGPLLSEDERTQVESSPGFVERYIEWAKSLGDAAWQYHQAGAFMSLSSLLAGTVRLPTSYGTIIPNLWFMILADTTLTRKSTAMDIAMDMVMELDPDVVLATDGSIEGLLTSLATRPGRPSIFLRDEFSGLLESIVKKDYYAGMPEMLTKLYDGKLQKRILRKEVIEVKEPVLLLFTGGIRSKILSLLTFEQVSSGFMPRFIFITAESDITRIKPLGPPSESTMGNRQAIKDELADMYTHYNRPTNLKFSSGNVLQMRHTFNAELTDDAWVRYNKLEAEMLKAGLESERPDVMTPTYDRLSKSTLKASMLLAASRQRDEKVVIEEADICHAIYFAEQWRMYCRDVMNNVGKSTVEKQLDTIYNAISKREGVTRSVIMQNYHLSARDADQIFATLEQRGLITRTRAGRTEQLFATRRMAR